MSLLQQENLRNIQNVPLARSSLGQGVAPGFSDTQRWAFPLGALELVASVYYGRVS